MKKIGFIILAVVLALGLMGAGYALWSQTLNIGASATMGTFDVNFTNATTPPAPDGTGGAATAVISDPGSAIGKTVTLTVDNAYPQWTGGFILTVTNSSSVPVTLALNAPVDSLKLWSASADPGTALTPGGTFQYTVTCTIPDWLGTTNTGASSSAAYTITATQYTP